MRLCDKCKKEIKKDLRIEVNIRGECRFQVYDLGIDTTFFEFCSIECAIAFLEEAKTLLKLKPAQRSQY